MDSSTKIYRFLEASVKFKQSPSSEFGALLDCYLDLCSDPEFPHEFLQKSPATELRGHRSISPAPASMGSVH